MSQILSINSNFLQTVTKMAWHLLRKGLRRKADDVDCRFYPRSIVICQGVFSAGKVKQRGRQEP